MKRPSLLKIESLLRRVVEEPFTWFSGEPLDPFQLAMYLARSYEDRWESSQHPNHFVVHVSTEDFHDIQRGLPELSRQVGDYTALLAERLGYQLSEAPLVEFLPDPTGSRRRARVVASFESLPDRAQTEVFVTEPSDDIPAAIEDIDAFLIVQGRRHVALDRPIAHVGRRIDNDIVIDEPSVSRRHAQIRWRQHCFVLYDVSSRGQTSINGVRVKEHVLRSGDVIALGDVLIVYGEGRDEVNEPLPAVEQEDVGTTLLSPGE